VPGRWLRRLRPAGPSATRLICLPFAGGAASAYLPLAARLEPEIEVVAVQYPGRQDRWPEPPLESLTTLADLVSEALLADPDRRPLALFGHSLGATLAYEVVRRLERDGSLTVLGLFASARRAPSRYGEDPAHARDDAALLDELTATGGLDPDIRADPELLELVLPAIRADYVAIESYRHPPGPVPRCPITLLLGDQDPLVTAEEARQWRHHTEGEFETISLPGGHFYVNEHWPRIATLVERRCRRWRHGAAWPASALTQHRG
jgi:surfactin synthase thioesterase subunit